MIGERTTTLSTGEPSLETRPAGDRAAKPSPRPRTGRRRALALVLALLLLVPGYSYVQALTYPGSATWQMRSVEWVRDHGGSPLVDRIENWYYTANRPSGSGSEAAAQPVVVAGNIPAGRGPLTSPARLLAGRPPVLGKNTWVPGRTDRSGAPAIYTSFFRPDTQYPSVVAGVAWIRARATSAHLVAGTREPGGDGWPGGARGRPGTGRHLQLRLEADGHPRRFLPGRAVRRQAARRAGVPGDRQLRGGHRRAVGPGRHDEPPRACRPTEPRPDRGQRPAGRGPGLQPRAALGELREPAPVHLALRRRGRRRGGPHLRGRGEPDPADASGRTGRHRGRARDGA